MSVAFAAALLTGLAQGTSLPVPVLGHELTAIGPGYYTFRYTGTRNVFLVTREESRRITPLPVKYVVVGHDHRDHVRGTRIFVEEGAGVVSRANCWRVRGRPRHSARAEVAHRRASRVPRGAHGRDEAGDRRRPS